MAPAFTYLTMERVSFTKNERILLRNCKNYVGKFLLDIENKVNSLWPQYLVFSCVCNNDCIGESDTAVTKRLLEIKDACSSPNFQDKGNLMKIFDKVRIKNANRLLTGHVNINSIRNEFEMLEEIHY